jgi:hypothetical protein
MRGLAAGHGHSVHREAFGNADDRLNHQLQRYAKDLATIGSSMESSLKLIGLWKFRGLYTSRASLP